MKQAELPYHEDSAALFAIVADEKWSIFFDSAHPYITQGRYDIISANPAVTLSTQSGITHITEQGKTRTSTQDPMQTLKGLMQQHQRLSLNALPFSGGAMGLFSYDLGLQAAGLKQDKPTDIDMPDMAVGIYNWAVVVDHQQRRSWLVSMLADAQTLDEWQMLYDKFSHVTESVDKTFKVVQAPEPNISFDEYSSAFEKIKAYIKAGDCYQVNLAQRYVAGVTGDPWFVYKKLREKNPAPFSCYFNLGDSVVLCSSPERFLQVRDNQVETKPIKGTCPRSDFAYEDAYLSAALFESEKNRAENVMIVDLLRNDLSKHCVLGTVKTPALFALESYASVHHLVSTVIGTLHQDSHVVDLLSGAFPGGSITGAPKHRTMQIIDELEPYRRHLYCGSMAYIGYDNSMDSNIIIRTMLMHKDKAYIWAGGGIVNDSTVTAEYQECQHKIAGMLKVFET